MTPAPLQPGAEPDPADTRDAAIVCGIDENYAHALRTLIRSIAVAHGADTAGLRMIVLDQGLTAAARSAILTEAESAGLPVGIRQAPVVDPAYPVSHWISKAVYARLSIPDVVDDEERVLYLDTDLMVLGDLRPLLTLALDGRPLAAVRDPQNPLVGQGLAMAIPGWRELGIEDGREYFNSGVMLIDLAEAKRHGLFETAKDFLTTNPDNVRFWDQDALNYAADDAWLRLDRHWNTFAISPLASDAAFIHHAEPVIPLEQLLADEHTAKVIHFAGALKPWQEAYPPGWLRGTYRGFQSAEGPAS
jgi:lipopolysaccharide biosynthesis glycosyltransferase